uniref:CD70 antigen n=2 Tax=Mandrillus leucophaeus TaxID=9568 RepID=A0A2K5XKD0_MANLE
MNGPRKNEVEREIGRSGGEGLGTGNSVAHPRPLPGPSGNHLHPLCELQTGSSWREFPLANRSSPSPPPAGHPQRGAGWSPDKLRQVDAQEPREGAAVAFLPFPAALCAPLAPPALAEVIAAAMPEEGSGCAVRRRPYACVLRAAVVPLIAGLAICLVVCIQRLSRAQQQLPLESLGWDIAELQLNHTGPQQDPRLYWQGGPALGRSFLRGPELDKGQLRIRRDGIYMVHIQVTLAICSSTSTSRHHNPTTLAVGICSPASRSISLLRLSFHQGCTIASQRLTPLARGDTLCTNLTGTLLPSRNTDETFFGVQWVRP